MSAPKHDRTPLTTADAIVVAALLLFIAGWVALWAFVADWKHLGHVGGGEAVFLLALIFLPPIWAGARVERVIG